MKYILSKRVQPYSLVKIKANKVSMTSDLAKASGQYIEANTMTYIDINTGKLNVIRLPSRILIQGGIL